MSGPPPMQPLPLPYASPGAGPQHGSRKWIGWVLFGGIAVVLFMIMALGQQSPARSTIPLSDLSDQLEKGNVKRVIVDGDELTGTLTSPRLINGQRITAFRTYLPTGSGGSWTFAQWLLANRNGAQVAAVPNNGILVNLVLPFIPWLLILVFIWFFVFRQLRRQNDRREPIKVVIVNPEPRA